MGAELLERVRQEAGLSQEELATRAGTLLPAYERGRKSPTLATVSRLLETAGHELTAEPRVPLACRRPIFVADRLWRLPVDEAFADVILAPARQPVTPGPCLPLGNRRQRARCYEIVLREGMPADLCRFIDGALLVDLWPDLVIPGEGRRAWQPVINETAV
jgi:transcriptional regulator with XRE-family HTH domain